MKRRKANHVLLKLDNGVQSVVGLTLLFQGSWIRGNKIVSLPADRLQDQSQHIEVPGLLLQLSEDCRAISRAKNSYVDSSDMLHYAIVPSFPLSPSIFISFYL